jgi:prepilin-type N-terminal cleavage/methylation domain-containing protein
MIATRTRRLRRRASGYTLIEVMVAVAIMTVGSVGIMALSQATTVGTRQAREMSTATHVTRRWVERVREDALRWNSSGATGLAGTTYLTNAPAAVATPGVWFAPGTATATTSFGADFFGEDTATAANMRYCTNVRLNWLGGGSALRVDVRTWWHRTGGDDTTTDLEIFPGCAPANAAGVTTELDATTPRLHAVYSSTVVRWVRRQ